MALFGKSKKTVKETKQEGAAPAVKSGVPKNAAGRVMVRPYMTEKAAMMAEKGTYVFIVSRNTTKNEVAKAVEKTFGVTVTRVNVVNVPEKKVRLGRYEGQVPGFKKAMITLKKGDKIDIGA